jgi:predicted methyltransferase
LASGIAYGQHGGGLHGPHRFEDPKQWSKAFDAADRDGWQKPNEVLAALKLRPDAIVADIGAGTGYFTVRLAQLVPSGTVYAVDIEEGMLGFIADRAKKTGLENVRTAKGSADSPNLPEKVDLVLIVDTYHHIDARVSYLGKIAASLKPGGRIAIVDFRLDAQRGAPKQMRLSPSLVQDEMRAAGFEQVEAHDFLPDQYFLIFQRKV